MVGTIEVDFLPQAFDEAKEKPRILIIDNDRDFTYSVTAAPGPAQPYLLAYSNFGKALIASLVAPGSTNFPSCCFN